MIVAVKDNHNILKRLTLLSCTFPWVFISQKITRYFRALSEGLGMIKKKTIIKLRLLSLEFIF